MTPISAADVVTCLEHLAGYVGRRVLAPAQVEPYLAAFVGRDRDRVLEGVRTWMTTHGPTAFMPSIAELEAAIRDASLARWPAEKRATPTPGDLFRHAGSHLSPAGRALLTLCARGEPAPGTEAFEDAVEALGFSELAARMRRSRQRFAA